MAILFHASAAGQESILVTESKIHLSTLYHPEITDFEKSLEHSQPGESIQTWEMSDITGLSYQENELVVVNVFTGNRIIKLRFTEKANLKLYVQYIATIQNFSLKRQPVDTFEAVSWQLLYMLSFLILTIIAVYQACYNESNHARCFISESFSPIWIRVGSITLGSIGVFFTSFFAARAWKIYRNPPYKIWYN